MRRAARVAVGGLAVVGAAAIVVSVLAQFGTDCTSQRVSGAVSPSGDKVAEHYQTTCRSDSIPRTEIQLIQNGTGVSAEIGVATTNSIGLAWMDNDSLLVTVPPGMDKAFDREMDGVHLKFQVVSNAARLTPSQPMEPTR